MCQPVEAHNFGVQDRVSRMHLYQRALRLHGELFRNEDNMTLPRVLDRGINDAFI